MKAHKKHIDPLLSELKIRLIGLYGERLKRLYLYGSYARGDQDQEPDLDILVVLDQFDSCVREIDRTSQLASDLSLKYGITVSTVFIREAQWLQGDTPFLSNVREEAISL